MRAGYCNGVSPSVLALGKLDLGHRDQDFGAGLQVRRFQQRLLLGRAIGRHHRERVDQRLVRRVLDAVPVGLQIIGLAGNSDSERSNCLRSTCVLALARDEIVGERRIGDAALPVGGRDLQFLLDAEARNAGELQQIAAIAALGDLGDASDAADLEQIRLVLRSGMRRCRAGSCRSGGGAR